MNNSSDARGVLYVVATPIGNLADLGQRALDILGQVNTVLAEDTRRTRQLLQRYGIEAKLESLHEHNEMARTEGLVARAEGGETMAVVSDAGTPLINDPGYLLVRALRQADIPVVPIPGPSAIVAALSVAGVPVHRFAFEGFLPNRKSARRERLAELRKERRALVFYEAPHRVEACIADLAHVFGAAREACVARELTKLHEQVLTGTLASLGEALGSGAMPARGEFVVVVAPMVVDEEALADDPQVDRWLKALSGSMSPADAARVAARATGRPRGEMYKRLMQFSEKH